MFFMLFGPIYLTLIVKIILTVLAGKRYSLKDKAILNVFLPIGSYLLILELLTLFFCIVTFAPLSRIAGNVFICLIALTVLPLFLIPFTLLMVSGYQGDKTEHAEKRAKEEGCSVGYAGVGNRPGSTETISTPAKDTGSFGLPRRFSGLRICSSERALYENLVASPHFLNRAGTGFIA